ncbi:MAG TPA: PqqD family protein [Vicinamibacterales bacterium]|nr:PqqD family protein [Vicinamibacterales bacterium]
MTEVSLNTTLRVSDDVVFRELDGEAVILNVESGIYFGLDPVGTRMWQLIGSHPLLDSVLAELEHEYDAPREVLEGDLLGLVHELIAKGLLAFDATPTA